MPAQLIKSRHAARFACRRETRASTAGGKASSGPAAPSTMAARQGRQVTTGLHSSKHGSIEQPRAAETAAAALCASSSTADTVWPVLLWWCWCRCTRFTTGTPVAACAAKPSSGACSEAPRAVRNNKQYQACRLYAVGVERVRLPAVAVPGLQCCKHMSSAASHCRIT